MKKVFPAIISLLLVVVSSQAVTITVDDNGPADYNDIQSAINAAVLGDIIIVSDGIYKGPNNRELNFNGKAVTLQSENGAQNCFIDCEQQTYAFHFFTGEGNGTVVDGFTISNGYRVQGRSSNSMGGAVYCDNQSSPTLLNCIIQNNYSSYGGGVYCTNSSSPIITNCTIQNNIGNYYGGGIYCTNSSSPVITNCTIQNNTTGSYGGGIYCTNSSPEITDCLIQDNSSGSYGAGLYCESYASPTITNCTIQNNIAGSYGGGIYCRDYAALNITKTTIRNNTAGSYSGGIYCWDDASINVLNSIISGNSSGSYAGGVYCYYASGTFTNTIFTENSTNNYGGGLRINYSTVTVTNCDFHKNTANYGGGIYIGYDSDVVVSNTIVSENNRYGICIDDQDWPIMENCLFYNNSSGNVYDWWYGDILNSGSEINQNPNATGNGEGDPLFAFEDDFHLIRGSFARDAGNDEPTGGLPETDIDGNPRIMDGGRGRILHVDIGAYEFNNDVPAIAVSPSTIEFFRERNAGNPDSQTIQIRNCGGETLNWSIDEDCSWLTVDPCTGDSTSEIDNFTVSVDSDGMPRGIYSTTLSITDPDASNSPRIVTVNLYIKGTLNVPNDYPSIQNAVNAAMEGETIEVESGTYNEDVTLNKKLELIGFDTPVINAAGSYAVAINADECVLDGFEISDSYTGIIISGCNNNIIRNNIITSNDTGIYIYESLNNTLTNNVIQDNSYRGLYLFYNSYGNTLRQNIISGSAYNFDVYFDLYGNPVSYYTNDIDLSNTVDGKPIYYLVGMDNLLIDSSTNAGCVYLVDCSNITVRDLTLSNNGAGVFFVYTDYSTIENINAVNNEFGGILLLESTNNNLTNNNAWGNEYGLVLSSSGSNTLRSNTLTDNNQNFICDGDVTNDYYQDIDNSNTMDGKTIYYLVSKSNILLDSSSNAGCVYAVSCSNLTIKDIATSNSSYGITFIGTTNSSIDNVTLANNSTAGMYLLNSTGCSLLNSNISNNYYGIYLEDSSNISMENCAINDNSNRGIYSYSSSIDMKDCTVNNNHSYGIYNYYTSSISMENCTVNNNSTYGIYSYYSANINMESCTIKGNSGYAMYCYYMNNINLTNCNILNNYGSGGIYIAEESGGSITNCTIYGNTGYYGGITCDWYNNITVTNSIIWANTSPQISTYYEDYVTASYCNIQGGYDGIGNIDQLPVLTPDGHLCSDSACIDKGDPFIIYSDGLPNFWEDKYFDPNIGAEPQDDPDNDDHINLNEYRYYSSNPVVPCTVFYVDANRPHDMNDGLLWDTAKRTIMAAVTLAENSDRVIIAPGTYNQQINLSGKQIIIQSKDPTDPAIVDSTILRRRLTFQQGESKGCTIDGLTLSNAYSYDYYCIICENSGPTISNCNITNNLYGILCENSAPLVTNCNISGNYSDSGGFLNSYNSRPEVRNSVISGNVAEMGGGIYCYNSELTINNSLITGNASQYEATAIYLQESTLNMNKCTIADNPYMVNSPAYSSVIYGQRSSLNISNSIIWNNASSQIRSDYTSVDLSYSDIKGGAQGILGYAENHSNINIDPLFAENGYWTMTPSLFSFNQNANWVEGDYHLKSQGWRWTSFSVHDVNWIQDNVTSKCIDAGNPGSPLAGELLTIPVDSNHDFGRNVRVNMGAYSGTNQASIPPNNWALSGDLNNDGTVDFVDMAQWSGNSFPEDIDNPADLNRNKIIDMADLMILTQDWLEQTSWF